MPEINFLYQALRIRVLGFRQLSWEKRLRTLTVFFKGARSALAMHDVRLRSLLGVPILNASLFITVIYSIREMVARDVTPDIMEGGLLWFTDLSEKDPNLALPLIALGLSYLSLDLSLPEHGRILRSIKDFLQSLLLVSTPYVMLLPTGVFCYWIPSSLFMIAQVRALKIPEVRKFLGIPNDHIPEHLRAP